MSALRLSTVASPVHRLQPCQCAAVRPVPLSIHRQAHKRQCSRQQFLQQQQPQRGQHAFSWVTRAGASETTSSGSSGAPEGQLSSALMDSMQAKIKEELQADTVAVSDVYGDGRHVSIDVVSSTFEGKNSVQRQRMVYKAIWLELQETVHAVDAMTTKTPTEAGA